MILAFYGVSGLGAEFQSLADIVNEKEKCWSEIIAAFSLGYQMGSKNKNNRL